MNTYLKLEIRVVCREVFTFKNVFIVFFETNQIIDYFYIQILKKSPLKPVFGAQNPFVFGIQ